MWPESRAPRMDMSRKSALRVGDLLNGAANGRGIGSRFDIAATVVAHRVRGPKYLRTVVTTSRQHRE